MNKYTIYSEYLNHSYKKILEACLEDEAIDTLKILENKDYLLLRINQLFSEVYVAEREKVIEEQGKIIAALHQNSQVNKQVNQSRKCTNCQLLMEHIAQLQEENKVLKLANDQNELSQERNVKKIQSMLLKQVQSLKNQVKRLQEQNIYKKIEFQEQKSSLQRENDKMKEQLREQKDKQSKLLQKLKTKMRQATEEKNILQNQVFNNLEMRTNEERELREMTSKFSDLTITREKLQNQLNYLRNQSNITQQRLTRVEEQNKFLREKDTLSQKQIKKLKVTNDRLKEINQKLQSKLQQSQKSEIDEREQNQKGRDHLKWVKQFQKKINELKMKLSERQMELVQKNLQNQKIIMKLTDELRKAQIKLDREIKSNKDEIKQQAVKTIQQKQSQWKEEKEDFIKKYEKLFSQKQKVCDRLQQKIITMNRNLIESQSTFNSQCRELQQQKIRLSKQIQIEKNNYNQIKKYYTSNKNAQDAIIKDYEQKYNEIISQKQQLQKSLASKQKQLKQLKRQILKQSQGENILQIKLEQFRHKYTSCNQLLDQQKSTVRTLNDQLKNKQKQLNELNKNLQQQSQQIEQKNKAIQTLKLSEKRLNDKNYRLQQLINEKRQLLHKIHQQNQLQVVDVFSKAQQTTAQARKQLQSYYISLLKTTEDKNNKYNTLQAEKMQQKELQSLKYKKEEVEEKMRKYKDRYQKQQLQNSSKQAKINDLIRENEQLKIEVNRIMDMVHEQKRKNINTIKSYQQKMLEYYNNFSEFKRQFYLSIKQQFKQLKKQLIAIYQLSQSYKIRFQQMCLQMGQKFMKQNEVIKQRSLLEIQKLRHQYQYDIIFKLQQEKKEIKMEYQIKLKQQSMQFYTIVAQKQYQIKNCEEKEHEISLKMNELQERNDCFEKSSREAIKKNQQLKQIINKMNSKVTQAQRACSNSQNELDYYKKANIELKRQINQLQTTFKTRIQECREKYSQQNERLFNKYQKQFSKFIVSNKKSMQFTMLSNSCSNLHIPTKGVASQGKLDKIQREIQQQKKKLNNMERQMDTKCKFQKPQKATLDKDTISKNEKYKKY